MCIPYNQQYQNTWYYAFRETYYICEYLASDVWISASE